MADKTPGHPPWVAVFTCMLCGKPHPYSAQRWVQPDKKVSAYYIVCAGCVPETKRQVAEMRKAKRKAKA